MNNNFKPDYLILPGESLKELLVEYSLSQDDLSIRIGISEQQIESILKGNIPINTEIALKLEKVFGISATYWNNLQKLYDETKARLDAEKNLISKNSLEKKNKFRRTQNLTSKVRPLNTASINQ